MKILHTMIRVKDIKKSLKFYEELLGLHLVSKKRLTDCDLYFLTDNEEKYEIELTVNDVTPECGYELGNGFGHLAFGLEDFDELEKKMSDLGVKYLYEPYTLDVVSSTIAFVKDPDGYQIELIKKNK